MLTRGACLKRPVAIKPHNERYPPMTKEQKHLEPYYASDRRVYNGALCSDMKKEIAHTAALLKEMKQAEPAASCVYFPMEDKYMVFVNNKVLTGRFHSCKQRALIEAIKLLLADTSAFD